MRLLSVLASLLVLVATEANATRPTKGRPLQTGQTTGYGSGSDGSLQKGLSPMFNDLGNGVIKDQRTGLFWEKKSDDGTVHDKDNTYTWGQIVSPYSMNGTVVTTFLAALNTAPCFAGHCDWRIPNIRELETLRDFGTDSPATFAAFNTDCTPGCTGTTCNCTRSDYYWSSTTIHVSSDGAWSVDFTNGFAYFGFKTSGYYVRAVRGGS